MPSIRRSLIVPVAAALIAASAGAAAAQDDDDDDMTRTVTVSATATVAAEPDMAHITSGVVSEAETAREALSRNSEAMRKVIDGLKSAGIAAADIRTQSFNVDPRYSSPRDNKPATITGYQARNEVHVTVRDLNRLGDVLDKLVSLGANQMGGLSFDVSKAETLKDEARKQAMANAFRRAQLYAAAAGAEVGEVIAIAEDVIGGGPRPVPMGRVALEAVPIERGTQQLEARVTVTWALK